MLLHHRLIGLWKCACVRLCKWWVCLRRQVEGVVLHGKKVGGAHPFAVLPSVSQHLLQGSNWQGLLQHEVANAQVWRDILQDGGRKRNVRHKWGAEQCRVESVCRWKEKGRRQNDSDRQSITSLLSWAEKWWEQRYMFSNCKAWCCTHQLCFHYP